MITKAVINVIRGFSRNTALEKPIEAAIKKALERELKPVHLEVINESPLHYAPPGSEDYFKVFVVSEKFNDLSLVKRHRIVNNIVKNELAENFVHALSIDAKTPSQWDGKYLIPKDDTQNQ